MAYLGYEQISVSNSVLDIDDLTVTAHSTQAELQADTANVRYTMDGATDPTTSSGMLLLTTSDPKTFLIQDVFNIRFIRDGGSDAKLNIHYFAGRDI